MSAPSSRATAVVGRRIGAAVVDLVVYLAACAAVFFALGPERVETASGLCSSDPVARGETNACFSWGGTTYILDGGRAFAFLTALAVLWLAYHGLYQALTPTTGKRIFRLDVVDRDGNRARLPRTLLRSAPLAAGTLLVFLGFTLAAMIGFVLVLVHPRHQRVGDMLARTFVVDRESVGIRVDTSVRH